MIDISPMYDGQPASLEQALALEGKKTLVLITRKRSPEGESLWRTTLPLDSSWAEISPYRPAPIGTYSLHLQPEDSEGIVEQQSEITDK